MSNLVKYNGAFKKVFCIDENLLNDNLTILNCEGWDSMAQMSLVSTLEKEFDIFFEPEDIVEFISYKKGKEILRKYKINI